MTSMATPPVTAEIRRRVSKNFSKQRKETLAAGGCARLGCFGVCLRLFSSLTGLAIDRSLFAVKFAQFADVY
jgi:hypothetical protein